MGCEFCGKNHNMEERHPGITMSMENPKKYIAIIAVAISIVSLLVASTFQW